MKFRPLHDRVLIKVLDSEEKTAGGIIIPDSYLCLKNINKENTIISFLLIL